MSKNPLHMLWSWFCGKPEPVELKEELLPESKTDLSESFVPKEEISEPLTQEEIVVESQIEESQDEIVVTQEEIVVESQIEETQIEEPKEE